MAEWAYVVAGLAHGVAAALDGPLHELNQFLSFDARLEPSHLFCVRSRYRLFHKALCFVD